MLNKLPQGYELHEIPPDYAGPVWIEGQLRQVEAAATKAALERAAQICDLIAENDMTCRGDVADLGQFGEAIRALIDQPDTCAVELNPHKEAKDEQQVRSEMGAMGGRQPVESASSGFSGGTPHLISCIRALLEMDAAGSLVPHGIGGHARVLLAAAADELAELRSAKERADFLEAHPQWLRESRQRGFWVCSYPLIDCEEDIFQTAKEAVEAAIAAQKESRT